MSTLNVYQRIAAVMKEVQYVQKDAEVGFGNSRYRAVSHDRVVEALRATCLKHGLIIHPSLVEDSEVEGVTSKGNPKVRYRGVYDVALVNIDNPADRMVIRSSAHAEDSGDKAPGKAITYATKSALLKAFMLQTGDDDEQRFEENQEHKAAAKEAQNLQKREWFKGQVEGFCSQLHGAENQAGLKALMDSFRPTLKQAEVAGHGDLVAQVNDAYGNCSQALADRLNQWGEATAATMTKAITLHELEMVFKAAYRHCQQHGATQLLTALTRTKDATKKRLEKEAH